MTFDLLSLIVGWASGVVSGVAGLIALGRWLAKRQAAPQNQGSPLPQGKAPALPAKPRRRTMWGDI